mgnify:FL=1
MILTSVGLILTPYECCIFAVCPYECNTFSTKSHPQFVDGRKLDIHLKENSSNRGQLFLIPLSYVALNRRTYYVTPTRDYMCV